MGTDSNVAILVCYNGKWVEKQNNLSYEGGESKGILVSPNITLEELVARVVQIGAVDENKYSVELKYSVPVSSSASKHLSIEDNDDLKFFIHYNTQLIASRVVPLIVSLKCVQVDNIIKSNDNVNIDQRSANGGIDGVNEVAEDELGTWMSNIVPQGSDMQDNGDVEPLGSSHMQDSTEGLEQCPPTVSQKSQSNGEGSSGVDVGGTLTSPLEACMKKRKMQVFVHGEQYSRHEGEHYRRGLQSISWTPNFREGQVFATKDALVRSIRLAAIRGNFQIRTERSDTTRVVVKCKEGDCRWIVKGRRIGPKNFRILQYRETHDCDMRSLNNSHPAKVKGVVSDALSLLHKYEDTCTLFTPRDIIKDMKNRFGMKISYSTAWRSRESALKTLRGSTHDSYAMLAAYCYELERENPGTLTFIHKSPGDHFKYFFVAFGPCISGFKSSMRPVLAVDATHLKSKYKGVLFVATAFDGNQNMYPVAFGIGDLETENSWSWFLSKLHEAIGQCPNLVLISNWSQSIGKVVEKVIPEARHGVCFHHMMSDIKSKCNVRQGSQILSQFERAAKSYRLAEFELEYRQINCAKVYKYLEDIGVPKWSRAHCDGRRYNVMTTNIAESLNSVLGFARMLPLIDLVEHILMMLQRWFATRRDEASKCKSILCPDFGDKKLEKRMFAASRLKVQKLNELEYNVIDGVLNENELVQLGNKTCSCRKFDLEQLPCKHAIAVCLHLNLPIYEFASPYYTRSAWEAAYAQSIYPVPPPAAWNSPEETRKFVLLPPVHKVMPGRPKKKCIPSQGENTKKRPCSRCGEYGHYQTTCRNETPLDN